MRLKKQLTYNYMSQPIDYAALAKQFGGVTTPTAQNQGGQVDYNALAKQFGGTTSVPPASGASPYQGAKDVIDQAGTGIMGTIAKYTTQPLVDYSGNAALRFGSSIYREGQAIGRLATGQGANSARDLYSPVGDNLPTKPGTNQPIVNQNTSQFQDALGNPGNSPLSPLRNLKEYGANGVALGTTLSMFGGAGAPGALVNTAETANAAATPLVKRIVSSALTGGAVGGTASGLSAGSSSLAKNDSAKDVLKNTLLSSLKGFGVGALAGGGGAALSGLLSKAEPLALNNQELSAVDKSKLRYLGTKGFDQFESPLQGGVIKPKQFAMTNEVKGLQNEFKDILSSSDPQKNINNVRNEMSRLQDESKSAFNGVNKSVNKNQVSAGIQNSINESLKTDTAFNTMSRENQTAYKQATIDKFLSYVKEGNLKGLDDGLEAFRADNAKVSDASLSKANDAIYQSVKQYIADQLPEANRATYLNANQKQAKLFDVAEILKGKQTAQTGTRTPLGNLLKYGAMTGGGALVGGGAVGAYNALHK